MVPMSTPQDIIQRLNAETIKILQVVAVGQHHVVEFQAVAVELRRVDVDAHRRRRTAAHDHLPHAVDLRQALLQTSRLSGALRADS